VGVPAGLQAAATAARARIANSRLSIDHLWDGDLAPAAATWVGYRGDRRVGGDGDHCTVRGHASRARRSNTGVSLQPSAIEPARGRTVADRL
jgi:hypothetical protein